MPSQQRAARKPTINAAEQLEKLEAEECRRSFKKFVQRAWEECDPDTLVWNWHMEAICEHLQAVAEGRIQLLLINIPPGHAKSMLVSVLWPVWRWIREPWWRVMTASYEIGLANRDAVKSRTLIQSPWFQKHFATYVDRHGQKVRWEMKDDQNNKSFYENTALGFRISLSVGGKATGYRGQCLVVDDPLNMNDASSKVKRDEVILWKTETMASRFNDIANREEVVIMQRLHEDDLSGYLLKAGGWQHLCLPSEFEEGRKCRTYALPKGKTIRTDRLHPRELFFEDPRQKEGDLLFPERYPKIALDEQKTPRGMGPIAYAGQHQQRPMPAGGGVMKEKFFMRRWHLPGVEPPAGTQLKAGYMRRQHDPSAHNPRCQRILVSDLAFKKAEDNDLVAIGIFDVVYPDMLMIDWMWDRMTFVESVNAIRFLRSKWSAPGMPFVRKICIEDRANGPAVIEVLKRELPGVYPVEPLGSKEARVEAAASFLASGNVWFPEGHPQLDDGIHQALTFPKGSHDDWIDMLAYGILIGLAGNKIGFLERLARW